MIAATVALFSYLLGSIPFAYIAGRILKGIDVRKVGDGNVGAVNAYRTICPLVGVAVMIADVCKGAAVVLIAQAFASQPIVFIAGLAVVAGHDWPVYLAFKGGRGEATTIGVMLVLLPQAMLLLLAICALPFLFTRNTMLAGAVLFAPLWLVAFLTEAPASLVAYSIALPCLAGIAHFLSTRRLRRVGRQASVHMRWEGEA